MNKIEKNNSCALKSTYYIAQMRTPNTMTIVSNFVALTYNNLFMINKKGDVI